MPNQASYTPKDFYIINSGSKPFSEAAISAVHELEKIEASDKAQAVPYVAIWEIDEMNGHAMHPISSNPFEPLKPLTMQLVETPDFGRSLSGDERFLERPPVSLERITIKTENPRGTILYRRLEFAMTVHRPDVVFDMHIDDNGVHSGDADSWSSLITPGQAFCMDFGWSAPAGLTNSVLTGEFSPIENKVDEFGKTTPVVIPSRQQIRFKVTEYKFDIGADGQMKFVISAFENGEVGMRRAFLVKQNRGANEIVTPYENDSKPLKELLSSFKNAVKNTNGAIVKNSKTKTASIRFGFLFDTVFAPKIKEVFGTTELKGIFMGRFNARAGTPVDKYGGVDMSGLPISDFILPLDQIERVFRDLISAGTQMTIYNFINPFLDLMCTQEIWDRSGQKGHDPSEQTIPHIVMKTTTNKNKVGPNEVAVYLFDVNEAFCGLSANDDEKDLGINAPRATIRKEVEKKNVPFISLVSGNSFILESSFTSNQDEKMSAIMINRYYGKNDTTREEKTTKPDAQQKVDKAPPPQQVYSPTLTGKITMLGNFVFDTFALVWIDFGVFRWDGVFNFHEREDVISPGTFTTSWTAISAGTDPLGTKGRPKKQKVVNQTVAVPVKRKGQGTQVEYVTTKKPIDERNWWNK